VVFEGVRGRRGRLQGQGLSFQDSCARGP
jgi:hypothetical protein